MYSNARHLIGISAFSLVLITMRLASSQAATATLTLEINPIAGSFKVFAEASQDDNFGIAGYVLTFDGDVTSLNQVSPFIEFAEKDGDVDGAGFSFFRSPDGELIMAAFQDTVNPTPHLIFGLGQQAGSFSALGLNANTPPVQPTWEVPLLIAMGTYDVHGDEVSIRTPFSPINGFVNLFTLPEIHEVDLVYPSLQIEYLVPEPASGLLAGLALLGLASFVRRRSCQARVSRLG